MNKLIKVYVQIGADKHRYMCENEDYYFYEVTGRSRTVVTGNGKEFRQEKIPGKVLKTEARIVREEAR